MPMRVVCAKCGKQFSAWDDLVGKQVQCPKCQHTMILGGANPVLDAPPAKSPGPAARSSAPKANPVAPARPQPPPAAQPTPLPPRKANPTPPPAPRTATPQPAPPAPQRGSPLPRHIPVAKPHPDFDSDDRLPLGCPKCNAPMKKGDDLCDACGYHLILKKVIDTSDMKKPNKTTGFERFFQDQLHETESSHSTMTLMKIIAAFAFVVMMVLCLGIRWWWVGVLVFGGGAALYWALYRQRAAKADGSTINQDPLSGIFWSMLLTFHRVVGWRNLQPPFSRVKSLTLRNTNLTDEELPELDLIAEVEALDVEGTSITDESIPQLRALKQLRFIVLRRTQITPSAVTRLQQELPSAMIWY